MWFMGRSREPQRSICPLSYALELFGDRWTLLVLRDLLLRSRRRYRELLACEEGIATNVLADRLRRLEERGFIRKQRDAEDARQYLYQPTEFAVTVVPMLIEMTVWGARTNAHTSVDPKLVRRFETDREGLIVEVQARIRREAGLA
jgi:DNA-binding HxlR family transcriptional regulator